MHATASKIVLSRLNEEQQKKCILENTICGSINPGNIRNSRRGAQFKYGSIIKPHDGVDIKKRLKLKLQQRKQKEIN